MSLLLLFTGSGGSPPVPPTPPTPPTPPPTPTPANEITGTQANIVKRLASLIPPSWFSQASPTGHWWVGGTDISALLQGFGNVASWAYSQIVLAKAQMRLLTSVGMFIDLWSYDRLGTYIQRKPGETDAAWKTRVAKEVVRIRVSRSGMYQAILDLTGSPPVILEPWNTGDAGAWSHGVGSSALPTPSSWVTGSPPKQGQYGWGTQTWTAVVLMIVKMPGVQGIPNIGGWSTGVGSGATMTIGAWTTGVGSSANPNGSTLGGMSWITQSQITGDVTTQDVYDAINRTKPVGVQVFVQLID